MKNIPLLFTFALFVNSCHCIDPELTAAITQSDVKKCKELLARQSKITVPEKNDLLIKAQEALNSRQQALRFGTHLDRAKFVTGIGVLIGSFYLHEQRMIVWRVLSFGTGFSGMYLLCTGYNAQYAKRNYAQAQEVMKLVSSIQD